MRRLWVDPWRAHSRLREFSQFIETEWPYAVDFAASATDRGTSVSSVAWSSEGTQNLNITNKALSSSVATADIASANSGIGMAKVVATYADGNTETAYMRIRIEDPETI